MTVFYVGLGIFLFMWICALFYVFVSAFLGK